MNVMELFEVYLSVIYLFLIFNFIFQKWKFKSDKLHFFQQLNILVINYFIGGWQGFFF